MRLQPRSCCAVAAAAAAAAAFQPDCSSEGKIWASGRSGETGARDVCLGGGGGGEDKQVCWGVPPGPVSDPPSLGGVGSAGGAIPSPRALCNYALT